MKWDIVTVRRSASQDPKTMEYLVLPGPSVLVCQSIESSTQGTLGFDDNLAALPQTSFLFHCLALGEIVVLRAAAVHIGLTRKHRTWH